MANQKILVIDDEQELLSLLKLRLEKAGYTVCLANNGREGIQQAKEEFPNAILLDLMMPGMDGFQVCKKLKSDGETSSIPIVALTALGEEESAKKALKLGVKTYIVKPFDSEMLLSALQEVLKVNIAQE